VRLCGPAGGGVSSSHQKVTLSGSTGSRHSRSGNTPNGLDPPSLALRIQPAVVTEVRGSHLRRVESWFAGKRKGDKPTDPKRGMFRIVLLSLL
jgi:hypothetical protein